MAQKTRQARDEQPNQASSTEQGESRENIPTGNTQQQGAGITNRPRQQEEAEQQSLPPRGHSKDGSHA